jgi:hypothetical protein
LIELSSEDLAIAHQLIAGAITSTEGIVTELSEHAKKLSPGIFDDLIRQVQDRVDTLRRISDALLDAELRLR